MPTDEVPIRTEEKDTTQAFPLSFEKRDNYGNVYSDHETGLTKREWLAGMIMQGLVQDPNMTSMQRAAEGAVEGADLLLKELAK